MAAPRPRCRVASDCGREAPTQQLRLRGLHAFAELEQAEREPAAPHALPRVRQGRVHLPFDMLLLERVGKLRDLATGQRRELAAGEDRRGPFVEVQEMELRATADGAQERRVAAA